LFSSGSSKSLPLKKHSWVILGETAALSILSYGGVSIVNVRNFVRTFKNWIHESSIVRIVRRTSDASYGF
jgi:hypothetical protein